MKSVSPLFFKKFMFEGCQPSLHTALGNGGVVLNTTLIFRTVLKEASVVYDLGIKISRF